MWNQSCLEALCRAQSTPVAEAVQQLRGEAMGKQVEGANRALVHFHGGAMSAHSVALFCNEEGL